uniref:Chitin-binding type-2 domain-containing protein n=1 Tax=Anopheles culicifacies TaxID=139723 RepID=A0A182MGD8_9DIPT
MAATFDYGSEVTRVANGLRDNQHCTSGHRKRLASAQRQDQEDPCKTKSKVVGDVTYCDRYWECINSQPELYDCPNGLVFAGKHRGVTEGCDYPWRSNYCDGKQLANIITEIYNSNLKWLGSRGDSGAGLLTRRT